MTILNNIVAGSGAKHPGERLIPAVVVVPAGEFLMGQTPDDKFANDTERPVHRVTFARDFALGIFPVSVREYRAFAASHAPDDPPDWPVAGVNWHEARAYCTWISALADHDYRLPSEGEWEYACRAGTTTAFSCGSTLEPADANYLYDEQGHPVGPGHRTPPGRYLGNAYGLSDLHGNVCEWTGDAWHPGYLGAPTDGTAWGDIGETRRVIRGGAWDYLPRLLRSSWRDGLAADQRRDNVGFRIAYDL